MCMTRKAAWDHTSLWTTLWSLYGNSLWRIIASQLWNSPANFPLLVAQNCHGAPVVQKIVCQVGTKATDTRTQSKIHAVSIDISVEVTWWRQRVSRSDHHKWWNVGCTHYPRNQAAINAFALQWISLQEKIQADLVGTKSDVHVVLRQTGILLINFLTRGETVNAEHYCKALQKWRQVFQNKRRGMLSADVVLLHNNTRPHTARRSTHFLEKFSWEVFNRPP